MQAAIRTTENPPSATARVGFFISAAVVAVFAILEYVYDWPIHLTR